MTACQGTAQAAAPPIDFIGETHHLATPVMAEVYVEHLLDRAAFRAHCARYQTRQRILAGLR